MSSLGNVPVYFEPNQGQFDPSIRFVSRGANYRAWIGDSELILEFFAKQPGQPVQASQSRIRFGKQKPSVVEGLDRFAGISNYFIGQDPKKWVTNVPNFAKAKLHGVYPGIDIVFYAQGREIEYDFIVHPGADPSQIELEFLNDSPLRFSAPGLISQRQPFGELTQQAPRVYQGRREVRHQARLEGRKLRFEYGDYDNTQDLVVDPTLSYATYVGGNRADLVWDQDAHQVSAPVRVDASGNLYFAALSFAFPVTTNNFPTTTGAYRTTVYGGVSDAVVVKLNPTGTALVFSTYLGSNEEDSARGIAIDSSNNVYVAGTGGTAFPTTAGAFQTSRTVTSTFQPNLFVTKLAPAGNSLIYSTFVGSAGRTQQAIAVSSTGEAVVGSQTCNPVACAGQGLPTPLVNPAQSSTGTSITNSSDATLIKLNASGSALVFSTYQAPNGNVNTGDWVTALALDSSDNIYITGQGQVTPTPGAYAGTAGSTVWVSKYSPAGARLWAAKIGGVGNDRVSAIALDSLNQPIITGQSAFSSTSPWPTTAGTVQTSNPSTCSNHFVTKFKADGTGLVWSTFVAGKAEHCTEGAGLAVDSADNVWTLGLQFRTDKGVAPSFPVTADALQGSLSATRNNDLTLAKLNSTGTSVLFGTYLGGTASEFPHGIALDSTGTQLYVAASAQAGFATTAGAFQAANRGDWDLLFAKIITGAPPQNVASSPSGLLFSSTGTGCDPGTNLTTPKALNWTAGSSCQLSFGSPQAGPAGTQYVFQQWENASTNATRSITAPSTGNTYTATFKTQYLLTTTAGTGGTVSAGGYYDSGATATVSATANTGYTFVNFTGDVTSTANPLNVTMSAPRSITANFTAGVYNVTIASVPAGRSFTVTGTGCSAGAYTAPQTLSWTFGNNCTVAFAASQSGGAGTTHLFQTWEDASTSASRVIPVPSAAATYTATFKTQFALTTAAGPNGSVSAGGNFDSGTTATVTATPNTGYTFVNFTGDVTSTTNPLNVTMSAPRSITANFTVGVYNVTIASVPSGRSFTVTGAGCSAGSYTAPQVLAWTFGNNCTVAFATPQGSGTVYSFQNWEDASTSASRVIPAPAAPATYTATFGTSYTLTVNSAPSGGGSIGACAGTCTTTHLAGAVVNLTATPSSGYTFSGWGGACTGTGSCSVTMDAVKSVTANFNATATTTLTALIGAKSGAFNARVWPLVINNVGPGDALGTSVDSFVLTQTLGAPCTPVILTTFPQSAGNIVGAGSTATVNVSLDVSSCAPTVRFKATIGLSANSGATTATPVLLNLLR